MTCPGVRDWPILFQGPLVVAIRESRKDVTRRLGKTWAKAKPGDTIWVRETWRPALAKHGECFAYRADETYACGKKVPHQVVPHETWHPSIFMPRKACRLHLGIVSVRQERLHRLTAEEAMREGIDIAGSSDAGAELVDAFHALWDKINGKKAPWSSNPLVHRIEFEVIS